MTLFSRTIRLAMLSTLLTLTNHTYADCIQQSYASNQCCEPCQPCCCGTIFLNADLLYLRAFEGGLVSPCDSIFITDSSLGGTVVSTLEARANDPNFDWNLGFGIGAGYGFANSNCDIGVYWMHYNSHTGTNWDGNHHNWKINFDTVDVLFSCACDWSSCFSLMPYGGIRYAKIDQRLGTHFINTDNGVISTATGSLREDFYGFGPLFGVEGDWRVGCGLSLYGYISVGVLYGTFNVSSNSTDTTVTGINVDHLRKHLLASQPVLDSGFGIRWKTCLCNCRPLIWQLGFEQHRYFNQNQFCNYGDLSLDGVSLGVMTEF